MVNDREFHLCYVLVDHVIDIRQNYQAYISLITSPARDRQHTAFSEILGRCIDNGKMLIELVQTTLFHFGNFVPSFWVLNSFPQASINGAYKDSRISPSSKSYIVFLSSFCATTHSAHQSSQAFPCYSKSISYERSSFHKNTPLSKHPLRFPSRYTI